MKIKRKEIKVEIWDVQAQMKMFKFYSVCSMCVQILRIQWTLRKRCPYSESLWSAFSRIWSEYGEIRSISPYSVRMQENADRNNSEYGHFTQWEAYIR